QARADDVGELRAPFRVAEVAAAPVSQDPGDVIERAPLEYGHVFGDARRAQAHHRRVGGAPGVVEPAPALLAERHERLAEQQRQPAVRRLIDGDEVRMATTHRSDLAVHHDVLTCPAWRWPSAARASPPIGPGWARRP